MGCDCPAGFVGPVCEFPDRGQAPVECNLECSNHGICRQGAKDVSMLAKYGLDTSMVKSFSADFEHCVCPAGYVGLQCEFQLDLCPAGQHACLNGGECMSVVDRSSMSYTCNCVNAESTTARFAGEYCEMESTQFCTLDQGKSRTGPGVNSFCTNGGTCKALVAYEEPYVMTHRSIALWSNEILTKSRLSLLPFVIQTSRVPLYR
jgi:EGF-like domain